MGYLEFEHGITGTQMRHMKEQREQLRLQEDMTGRWRESERILSILRTVGAVSGEINGLEEWFSRVKVHPRIPTGFDERLLGTPSGWFSAMFPDQTLSFGTAFFEETARGISGSMVIRPSVINEDFFAAMLGGERRLGHKVVYLPGDGFWFKDPRVDAFCPTTDKKVEVLLSNYLVKCAENMRGNVDASLLIKDHRRADVLSAIVKRARTVLEADPRFFEGVDAPRRFLSGRTVQPALSASPEDFIHRAFVPLQGASVVVSEAYQGFLRHCQMENLLRVQFTEFKRAAKDLVMEKFQLGLRHDIRTREGRQTHGWKHLSLVSDLPGQVPDAA